MGKIHLRHGVKLFFRQILALLPPMVIEWLGQFPTDSSVYRIAKQGVYNRDITIQQGIAKGLRFNSGDSNPTYALGTNEPPVQQALAHCLKPGDTFYDIGANVGFFTVIGAHLVGQSGQVYAFEPVSENAALLQRNLKLNGFQTVTVIEKAVSCFSGQGELLLAHYSGGSVLSTVAPPPDLKGQVPIEVVSIDDLIAQEVLQPPTVVKIDVEGAELNALRGMAQTIRSFQPIILYEIDDGNRSVFEQKQAELQTFMQEMGYSLSVLEDSYPDIGWHVGHVIATPISHFSLTAEPTQHPTSV